jgi:hypothetical protein
MASSSTYTLKKFYMEKMKQQVVIWNNPMKNRLAKMKNIATVPL